MKILKAVRELELDVFYFELLKEMFNYSDLFNIYGFVGA